VHELLTKSRRESVEIRTPKQFAFPFDLNEQNSVETPYSVASRNLDLIFVATLFREFSERRSDEAAEPA
jgi:hypothetical protein